MSGSISKMSHSIFHQTLLCQTSTVAEHQSKRGVIGNSSTLFQSQQSVDKEKKLFLSTNFRGNSSFFVRKRKVAMGSKQTVPRAVLTSNAASQVCVDHHCIVLISLNVIIVLLVVFTIALFGNHKFRAISL